MAEGFKSGTKAIPAGVTEFNVTGLALGFDPSSAQVAVRQPAAEAEIVTAFIAGTLTRDGFKVILSSPVSGTEYLLDYTVFSGSVAPTPVDTGSLVASYSLLKEKVAYFLGYDTSALTAYQVARIDDIIQSGVRRFYYPPAMEGVDTNFEWSFLRAQGELETVAGTGVYLLPDGFNRICGSLIYGGEESAADTVPVIPFGEVSRMIEGNPNATGRPRVAAVAAASENGNKGQRRKIYLFPKPDKAYTLKYRCDADQGKISDSNPFPLGGAMYAELIIESCLSVAEMEMNDEAGLHTQNFNALLVSTIARDRKAGAQEFGKIGDPKYRRFW